MPAERTLSMPVADWPARDRRLWQRAQASRGSARNWSDSTLSSREYKHGRWLTWIQRNHGSRVLDASPIDRFADERFFTFVDELERTLAPHSVAKVALDVVYAATAMCPERKAELDDFRLYALDLSREAVPVKDKQARLVDVRALRGLGLRLTEQADLATESGICTFIDGLIIAILASAPIRVRSLLAFDPSRNLQRGAAGYDLAFEGGDAKWGVRYSGPLPAEVTAPLDRYIDDIRPARLAKAPNPERFPAAFWVSVNGLPISEGAIWRMVTRRTQQEFGKRVNPHLTRDAAGTYLANEHPELVGIVPSILGHTRHSTSERHYIHADRIAAVRKYQATLLDLLGK